MVERSVGTVCHKRELSSTLMIFGLMPEAGSRFPSYMAGQSMALRRDDCKLTRKVGVGTDGTLVFEPDLDEAGRQRIGPVTHPYTIAAAPWEPIERGFIEFYVTLEIDPHGMRGRLSQALFAMDPATNGTVTYFNRITGSFTLENRSRGFDSVVMVGTGTGLAPFISMVKQLHYGAVNGRGDGRQYTLFHTNRTYRELGYHRQLLEIEAAGRFDFVYVPTVSRPAERDVADRGLGQGRASNVLRHVFDLPTKEAEALHEAKTHGIDVAPAQAALAKSVRPMLPRDLTTSALRERCDPSRTILLACGNPASMADVALTAQRNHIRVAAEEW